MLLFKVASVFFLALILNVCYVKTLGLKDLDINSIVDFDTPLKKINEFLNFDIKTLPSFAEIASQNGYYAEEHPVTTEDGYILKLHRIQNPNCSEFKGYPVFLMHGLFLSSESYIDAGVDNGLAYLIADECRDVWAGNYRGNFNGRQHVKYNPDTDAEFWHFSVDEMAEYDIPAFLNFILQTTKSQKVNYVGFSLGGLLPFLMSTDSQEYVDAVINLHISLSSPSTVLNTKSPLFRLAIKASAALETLQKGNGVQEFLPRGVITKTTYAAICQLNNTNLDEAFCPSIFNFFDAYHEDSITDKTYTSIYKHAPSGNSIRVITWFEPKLSSNNVTKFNFGTQDNVSKYGSAEPPAYDFSKFNPPTVFIHGKNDWLVNSTDIKRFSEQIPNVLEFFEIDDPKWNHLDQVYNPNIASTTFPTIKKYLDKYL